MLLKDTQKILRCLDALLAYGNFTKAAHALYISQPYLTQFIQKLEQELHIKLINRAPNHLQLTEAGKVYYTYLEKLESDTAQFDDQLRQYITTAQVTTLKIGILSTLGSYLLPQFLPQFLATHPQVQVVIKEDLPQNSEAKLLEKQLDFYIGQNPETLPATLTAHTHGQHHYLAIIPANSALYSPNQTRLAPGTIAMKTLLSEPLLLTKNGSAIRRQVDYLLQHYQVEPHIVVESDNIFTIYNLSQKGCGITIIPEELTANQSSTLPYNIYPLSDQLIAINFFMAQRTDATLNPAAQDLLATFLNMPA